jgi:hypothetical protein
MFAVGANRPRRASIAYWLLPAAYRHLPHYLSDHGFSFPAQAESNAQHVNDEDSPDNERNNMVERFFATGVHNNLSVEPLRYK